MVSIKRNYFYNSVYQMLLILIPLITTPYISRKLGADGIGIYSYSYTVANYFLIFAKLGVDNYGNRSIAKVRDDKQKLTKIFWSIYFLQFALSAIFILLYGLYLTTVSGTMWKIAFAQTLLVISGLLDINWFFFGLELFKITTLRSIGIKLLNVIAIFVFVKDSNDLWKYTLIMVGGIFISQIIVWPLLINYVFWSKPTIHEISEHIKPNLLLFIPVIAVSLYKWMDKIMLGNMSNMTEVGYFENAEKLIGIPMGFITALGTVMLPRMSHLAQGGHVNQSKEITEKSMMFTIFLSSAMAFGIVGISQSFVPLFFGKEFIPVITLLKFMAPSMIFIGWANVVRTQYLLPNSKDTSYIISVIIGAIVNIGINIFLIPVFGAVGASVGTLFAEVLVCIVQTVLVWTHMDFIKYLKNGIPFIIFGMIMYLAIYNIYIVNALITISAQLLIGSVIYVFISYLYVAIFKKELVQEIFNRK